MATTEKSTLSGEPLKAVSSTEATEVSGAEAVKVVAEASDPTRVPQSTQQSALDWFIGGEAMGGEDGDFAEVKINVGGEDKPKWIVWKLKPIELQQLRLIRKRAGNTRDAKRTGVIDEFQVNLEIVAVSTVEPSLSEAAKAMGGIDPVDALRERFKSRPGYITQLAGKVLTASGFDEEDIQDSTQVAAAGNS
jgi:hypothetical protein